MAWIGAIAAASAYNDGRRRKKPSKLVFLVTIFSLVLGIFVPLVIILGMNSNSTMTLFPFIFIFIIMIGIVVLVAVGCSDSFDQDDEIGTVDGAYYRSSGDRRQRSRNTSYHKHEPEEEYYWGSASKSSPYFCTNCGIRLESDDRFCASCGRRVT